MLMELPWDTVRMEGCWTHTRGHILLEAMWLYISGTALRISKAHIYWTLKILVLAHLIKIHTLSCFANSRDGSHQIICNILFLL